jgi:tetratricopeptide (TPR) repeat protein
MNQSVILSLGPGNFQDGFPAVTARLGQPGQLGMQFTGSLPPAPEIPQQYRNWQVLYEALYRSRSRGAIEIMPVGITHISEADFSDLCQALEDSINTWFAADSFRKIEQQLRTQLNSAEPVQVTIEADDPDIWRIPLHLWHFFKDEYRLSEVALSTPDYPAPAPPQPQTRRDRVKILAILGNSNGINVRKDLALLQKLPNVELKFLVEPQRQELTDSLWQQGWDILFFAGHSSSHADAKQGRLYINQNADNNSLTIEELREALSQAIYGGLKLAIFNSCDGLGLARDLASAHLPLPATIVMREPVADAVAQAFLKYFLRAFAFGEPFHLAVRQAREQLRALEDEFPSGSWLPVICQHPAIQAPVWLEPSETTADLTPQKLRVKRSVRRRSPASITRSIVLVATVTLGGYFTAGPQLARWVNQWGQGYHERGQLFSAQLLYRTASLLDARFGAPHYNLGWLCDEMGDRACAITEHQRAALRGFAEGYAEASRLQILSGNELDALRGIRQCLARTEYDGVRASCLKNLGWIRSKQQRYAEAEVVLKQAIELREDSPHAHCLLGEVLAARGQTAAATRSWQTMLKYTDENVPEQDECIGRAKQRLGF